MDTDIKEKIVRAFKHYTGESETNNALRAIATMMDSDTSKPLEYKRNNLRRRLDKGKFSQDDLKGFADLMGCEYISEFLLPNGVSLSDGNEKYLNRTGKQHMDLKTMVDMMCIFTKTKQKDFLEQYGMRRTDFISKIEKGKLRLEELNKIAEIFGAEYRCRFRFDDCVEF